MKIAFIVLGTENLGIEYLAAALARQGHQTRQIFDPGLFHESNDFLAGFFNQQKNIMAQVLSFGPDLVGFSVVTSTYQWACRLAQAIKALLPVPIIFGGYHPSSVPENVLSNDFVDWVCVGEGEEAICELASQLARGQSGRQIKNIWTKDNTGIIRNPPRPLVQDLDQLPFPDKSIYQAVPLIHSKYMIITSRGCPFDCTFCGNSFLHELYPDAGRKIRRRSIGHLLAELKEGKARYNFKQVLFVDDAFGQDRAWIREFLGRYRQEIKTPFYCGQHVNYLDAELIRLLKDAGCFLIQTGIETVSEKYRKEVLNRPETNTQIEFVLRTAKAVGLKVQIDHIFGLPQEGEVQQQEAAEFYNRTRPDSIACFRFTYYPGTKMLELARTKGWLSQAQIENIREGKITDYGNYRLAAAQDPQQNAIDKSFLLLFKLLPLLPRWAIRYLIHNRRYRFLRFLPYHCVDILRIMTMIVQRDRMLLAHYRFYLHHILGQLAAKINFSDLIGKRRTV